MYFEGRELNSYAQPVLPSSLHEGEVYFAVNYVDRQMLVPLLETLVFIGKNLEAGDIAKVYFQDIISYQKGVPYQWEANDETGNFFCASEDEINHIFTYEQLLNELMKCSLRRASTKQ